MLALLRRFVYNTSCRHDIGLSPNGKALDSDSSILGVRVPQAQLTPSQCCEGFFVAKARQGSNVLAQFFICRAQANSEKLCSPLFACGIGQELACTIKDAGEDICYDRTGKNTMLKRC